MRAALWSATGGNGVTALSCALASHISKSVHCSLVDTTGDAALALGVSPASRLGVSDWLIAGEGRTAEALRRIAEPVTESLSLVALGTGTVGPTAAIDVSGLPSAVIDLGRQARIVVSSATKFLVIKQCYLSVRHAEALIKHCDALIVVQEDGRQLKPSDLSEILGKPVAGTVSWNKSVARMVDVGMLQAKPSKKFSEELERIATWLA